LTVLSAAFISLLQLGLPHVLMALKDIKGSGVRLPFKVDSIELLPQISLSVLLIVNLTCKCLHLEGGMRGLACSLLLDLDHLLVQVIVLMLDFLQLLAHPLI